LHDAGVPVSWRRCSTGESEIDPQHYASRSEYRPPAAWYRRLNTIGIVFTSLGLAPRHAVTLEVRGRSSGKTRRLPILVTPHEGFDYLVALAGESQWVRNVRADAGRAVIRRRRARQVRLEELPVEDRAEVLTAYLAAARKRSSAASYARQARFYFGLDPDPSPGDIVAIAPYYPVFRIVPIEDEVTA
jgi:hypothetical protein